MANVLYLVHRLPYPPNKCDKVRSFHLLKHLAERHRIFLGTFPLQIVPQLYADRIKGWQDWAELSAEAEAGPA